MTRRVGRLSQVALVGILFPVLAGCGAAVETSPAPTGPAAASASAAASSGATTTASATPGATASPVAAAQARNPAAMDGAVLYDPIIDPAAFVEAIDNPYWPLTPGTSYAFKSADEEIKVQVMSERRVVMGVSTVVVKDQVFADGELVEDTDDWFAQDRAGNVWYFGEATTSFEDDPAGNHAGSWEAGVDGALPGIVMLADPKGGDIYRQEYYAGEAEDLALVRHAQGVIKVPAGSYTNVLVTEEWTPLTPDEIELKYYARGVGLVAVRTILGGNDVVQLVKVTPPAP